MKGGVSAKDEDRAEQVKSGYTPLCNENGRLKLLVNLTKNPPININEANIVLTQLRRS